MIEIDTCKDRLDIDAHKNWLPIKRWQKANMKYVYTKTSNGFFLSMVKIPCQYQQMHLSNRLNHHQYFVPTPSNGYETVLIDCDGVLWVNYHVTSIDNCKAPEVGQETDLHYKQ